MSNDRKLTKKGIILGVILLLVMVVMTTGADGCPSQAELDKVLEEVDEARYRLDRAKERLLTVGDRWDEVVDVLYGLEGGIATITRENAAAIAKYNEFYYKYSAANIRCQEIGFELRDAIVKRDKLAAELKQLQELLPQVLPPSFWPCFACDTLVLMADSSLKHISDVQVGDVVQAYDVETGQTVIAEVTATNSGEADYYYLINGNLKVTPPHPFFTAEGKWVKVTDLKVGDRIRSFQGLVEITSIEKVNSGQRICNISVRDFHNFFVSADGKDFYLVQE